MIVVTVFLYDFEPDRIHLVQNRKEKCHYDHIPSNLKEDIHFFMNIFSAQIIFFSSEFWSGFWSDAGIVQADNWPGGKLVRLNSYPLVNYPLGQFSCQIARWFWQYLWSNLSSIGFVGHAVYIKYVYKKYIIIQTTK